MACYHPLNAYRTSTLSTDTGKRKIVFAKDNNLSDEYLASIGAEKLRIPCGQCLGCRLEYSRQWAVRCALEAKQWEHNYFVTLTYDDDHVPYNIVKSADGSHNGVMTLVPRDLQLFLKRLRTYSKREFGADNIRFFACGEYGPKNGRPHFHLILFNCPLPDLKLEKYANGYTYYRSAFLEKVWNKGFVLTTDFTFECAAYVARYMLKKHKGKDSDYYAKKGIAPEFTRSSRRPGIGRDYLDNNLPFVLKFDEVILSNGKGKPIKCRPPKFFDNMLELSYPEYMAYLKKKRQEMAIRAAQRQLENTTLNEMDYLAVKENNKALSIKNLERSL